MRERFPIALAVLTLLVTLGAGAPRASAQTEVSTYTPSRIQWKELHYKASKMGVKAASEVEIRLVPEAEASAALIEGGEGAVMPSGGEVAEIVIGNLVKGVDSVSTLLLDPSSGAALQRSQVSRDKKGKHTFYRTYRYLDEGVFVERRFPPSGQADSDPLGWPVNNTRTIPFADGLSGRGVTEAMALFYILSAADFSQVGDRLRFVNFDRDGMSEVVMTVEETVPWSVDYVEVSGGKERRVKERRNVARLTISGKSVGGGEGAFEFLGLRGQIEIFADPELRVPVAVRGKVPVAGRTTVQVNRIVVD